MVVLTVRTVLFWALIACGIGGSTGEIRGQLAPGTVMTVPEARLLAADALNLEKQGRSLEAQESYEKIARAVGSGYYSEDLVAAAAFLDAARMRIKSASQYKQNINRETNLATVFSELKQAEKLLNEAASARFPPWTMLAMSKLSNTPIAVGGSGCAVDGRKLLLARLFFVRGNLDQSAVEIENSLAVLRDIKKKCPHGDPAVNRMISYASDVERQVRNSPFSRDNLLRTAETLSKIVPEAGAFLPSLIDFVNQWAQSNRQPPPL